MLFSVHFGPSRNAAPCSQLESWHLDIPCPSVANPDYPFTTHVYCSKSFTILNEWKQVHSYSSRGDAPEYSLSCPSEGPSSGAVSLFLHRTCCDLAYTPLPMQYIEVFAHSEKERDSARLESVVYFSVTGICTCSVPFHSAGNTLFVHLSTLLLIIQESHIMYLQKCSSAHDIT